MLDRWPEGHGSVCEQRNAAVVGTALEGKRGRGRGEGGREILYVWVLPALVSPPGAKWGRAERAAIFRPGTD